MTTYHGEFSTAELHGVVQPDGRYGFSLYDQSNPARSPRAVQVPQAAQRPNTYYAGQGTAALLELKARMEGVLLAFLGYKAGTNYYNLHHDLAAATTRGLTASRRWLVWLFFVKVWLGSLAMLGWLYSLRSSGNMINEDDGSSLMYSLLIFLAMLAVPVLVTYCRNVDYSLFQRRALYKVVHPVAKLLEWCPAWVMYLICFVPLLLPA